ncbi:MAG: hypothetical protein RLZZ303_269, partial [Candidatus Hydrogenedentota bacterium]
MSLSCRVIGALALLTVLAACGGNEAAAPPPATPDAPARRIVSLVPSFTETLFALGAGDRVVGVSAYCNYPEAARALPKAGGYHDPNYEAIIALKPDLVLLSAFREETAERLARFGISTRGFPHGTLEEVLGSIEALGVLTGESNAAERIMGEISDRIGSARAATQGRPRERVLLVVGRDLSDTAMREIYAAGPQGFLNDLLTAAGADNALKDSLAEYPILTAEGIVALNPDRVFEIVDGPKLSPEAMEASLAAWSKLPHRDLHGEGRVHLFTGDYMNIPGPRMSRILEDFMAALHPDLV